jgi:hypothetical protein
MKTAAAAVVAAAAAAAAADAAAVVVVASAEPSLCRQRCTRLETDIRQRCGRQGNHRVLQRAVNCCNVLYLGSLQPADLKKLLCCGTLRTPAAKPKGNPYILPF